MLRRILACFALITGLAAIGAPVEARMLAAVSQQVEDGAAASQSGQQPACAPAPQRPRLQGKDNLEQGCRPRRPIVIYLPTIQLGPDRARE